MSDPRDPVTATLRWRFPFDGHGASHAIVFGETELPVTQIDASTAQVELADVELSRELYDAIAGGNVTFESSAEDE